MRLRVGARGSDLSLAQTGWLIERLRAAAPELDVEIIVIETHGDREQSAALDKLWPPGGFVKEIELALLDGRIDMAVHSLKDIPTEPVPGLTLAAIPEREDSRDVLLTRGPANIDALPTGFVIGSSSPRRTHQMQRRVPHISIEPIRGNVPTRIRKMMDGEYDGIILAAAGLSRLKIQHEPAMPLPIDEFLPAPGQGALAAQTRDNDWAQQVVAAIEHAPTRAAVVAERSFLRANGGGCHAALGALATVHGHEIVLKGHLFRDDQRLSGEVRGTVTEAEALGARLVSCIRPG